VTPHGVAVAALLALAGLTAVVAVAGVALMPGAYNKLHYTAPFAVIGSAAVAAAVLTVHLFDTRGIKALLVFGTLAVLNPVVTHAIARAARLHESRPARQR
jgi:multicomponent Na+:H+ antiporter subunit G